MFTFSDFEVENRVRYSVNSLTKRLKRLRSNPAAGFRALRGPCSAGKERIILSLASPVFCSFKTPEILEPLPRKPLHDAAGVVIASEAL
jgi:hypothetical protein